MLDYFKENINLRRYKEMLRKKDKLGYNFIFLFYCLLLVLFYSVMAKNISAGENPKRFLTIAGYNYELPSWWDSVEVDVPDNLKNWQQVSAFVMDRYGMDTGTEKTWKEALKTWAIASKRLNHFPVYLAHCYKTGGDYQRAAQIYGDLYNLADTQKEKRDWYRVYLAFNAGEAYVLLKDFDKAKVWYSRAAEYVGHKDSAIDYYARKSSDILKTLDKKK